MFVFFYHDSELTLRVHAGVQMSSRRLNIGKHMAEVQWWSYKKLTAYSQLIQITPERISMSRLPALVIVAFAWLSLTAAQGYQLSCDSQLRLVPSFAHLFTHCGSGSNNGDGSNNNGGGSNNNGDGDSSSSPCEYGTWSDWAEPDPPVTKSVPVSQCESGMARQEERRQSHTGGRRCEERREERYVCKFRQVCCHAHIWACATAATELCNCVELYKCRKYFRLNMASCIFGTPWVLRHKNRAFNGAEHAYFRLTT